MKMKMEVERASTKGGKRNDRGAEQCHTGQRRMRMRMRMRLGNDRAGCRSRIIRHSDPIAIGEERIEMMAVRSRQQTSKTPGEPTQRPSDPNADEQCQSPDQGPKTRTSGETRPPATN